MRKKLAKYYAGPINPAKAAKIAKIFESTGSQEYCQSLSLKYKNQALKIIQKVFPDICPAFQKHQGQLNVL